MRSGGGGPQILQGRPFYKRKFEDSVGVTATSSQLLAASRPVAKSQKLVAVTPTIYLTFPNPQLLIPNPYFHSSLQSKLRLLCNTKATASQRRWPVIHSVGKSRSKCFYRKHIRKRILTENSASPFRLTNAFPKDASRQSHHPCPL